MCITIAAPTAAHAASQCFTDPTGDTSVVQPKGDIVRYCLTLADNVTVSVGMATPADPRSDAYWTTAGRSGVFWTLGSSDDPHDRTYAVGFHAYGSSSTAVFRFQPDGSIAPVCDASLSYADTQIQVAFPADCIGAPTSAYVAVESEYDAHDPRFYSRTLDIAPNGPTMSGPVATDPPPPTEPVSRIAGADRVVTALMASQAEFQAPGSAGGVVLASGDNYPDALVGVPLAAARNAPILLTPRDSLPDPVYTEIQRAAGSGKPVYVLGGESAIGPAVVSRLVDAGFDVRRFGGTDRYETAVLVAGSLGRPGAILEATGRNFPDALAAGSAAGKVGGVVLLTDGSTMPASAQAYVDAFDGVARVAVGGAAAAADPAATALVGASRYETAVAVAGEFFPGPPTVGVASGENYPDALVGGLHALRAGGPLVLTTRDALPSATSSYLRANRVAIRSGWIYGGTVAVGTAVKIAVSQAIA